MVRWIIIGAGRCGLQLARALARRNGTLAGIICRSPLSQQRALAFLPKEKVLSWSQELPRGTHLLIAVQDRELVGLVTELRERNTGYPVVLHTSGSQGPEVLAPLRPLGTAVGVFHPLVPFPHHLRPRVKLQGAVATLSGDAEAISAAQALAQSLSMRGVVCSSLHWPLYHAAANLAGPLLYALLHTARAEILRAGFPQEEVANAVKLLAHAVVDQWSQAQDWELLTGPIARGDLATVAVHLSVLKGPAQHAYQALSRLIHSSFDKDSPL